MLLTRTRPGLERSRNRAIEEEDERYNPIRPSNGNMVIRGGSDVARSSRTPRLSMADSRAREIQTRRLTPGTGATPTMGLSEVRGGSSRIQDMMKSLQQTRAFDEGQNMGMSPMGMLSQLIPRYLSPAQQGQKRPMTASNEIQLKQAPELKRRGRGRYCGGAAVPSMGLSQFRGGAKLLKEHLDKVEEINDKINSDSSESKTSSIKVIGLVKKALKYILKHLIEDEDNEVADEVKGMLEDIPSAKDMKSESSDDLLDKSRELVNELEDLITETLGGVGTGGGRMCGGANIDDLLDRTNVARSGAYEGQGYMREKSMPPVAMRGGKYHRDGSALSEHLLSTLGNASHKKLVEGLMRHALGIHGGAWYDFLDPRKNGVARAFEDFGAKTKNEFVNPDSILRGKILPTAAKVGTVLAPVINAASSAFGAPGVGTAISSGLNTAEGVNQGAKSIGLGRRCGGKKRRAPAGASDGRRARADIVRRVMAERGVKMIEASKIVKAEGLY